MVLYADGAVQLNYLDTPPLTGISLNRAWPLATVGVQVRGGRFFNQIACVAGEGSTQMTGVLPVSHQSIRIQPGEHY
ncbi:MAG: hypothetical protein IPK16_09360 [Anaerolineales bacterium]|nr:hypothetical protein [Anaerolineales bacterium]